MADLLTRLNVEFPGLIVKADGSPFTRPAWTGDTKVYSNGWYWQNADGDRFYFDTAEACAEDAAPSLGIPVDDQGDAASPSMSA